MAYIASHFIPLDHQQIGTVSAGASYNWDGVQLSADLVYGTGLRRDGATPNGDHVPSYTTVNLGVSHTFDIGGMKGLTARFDIINLLDEEYEIRDGTGVGVGAPQPASARDPDSPREASPGRGLAEPGEGSNRGCWYPDGRGTYAEPFHHTSAALERP